MVKNKKGLTLKQLLAKLKTRSLGLDDFEKLVSAKRTVAKKLEENADFAKQLMEQHSVKLDEKDPRFFDSSCKEEDTQEVNKLLTDFDNKEFELPRFLDKKKLQALKHENDLTIEEYELLTEAFFVEAKEKEPKKKK